MIPCQPRERCWHSSKIERLVAEGDVVVAETAGTAENIAGMASNNRYCQILTIREGRI